MIHFAKAFRKRKTLHYIHSYHEKSKNTNKKHIKDSIINYSKISKQSKHSQSNDTIKHNASYQQNMAKPHIRCSRAYAYFSSRYVIIYNPVTKQQIFYQGHKFKITTIAIHPLSK